MITVSSTNEDDHELEIQPLKPKMNLAKDYFDTDLAYTDNDLAAVISTNVDNEVQNKPIHKKGLLKLRIQTKKKGSKDKNGYRETQQTKLNLGSSINSNDNDSSYENGEYGTLASQRSQIDIGNQQNVIQTLNHTLVKNTKNTNSTENSRDLKIEAYDV